MKTLFFRITLTVLSLWLSVFATPLYAAPAQVELIVFAYSDNIVNDDEWFTQRHELIRIDQPEYLPFQDESEVQPGSVQEHSELDQQIIDPHPVAPTQLNNIAKRIAQSPDMELLTHLSWIQEPNPKIMTMPVYLDLEFEESSLFSDLTLSGTAMLYEVQLLLQFELDATFKPLPDTVVDTAYLPQPVSLVESGPSHSIFERRRVQIDEVHYMDHPKFGAVFTVVRP